MPRRKKDLSKDQQIQKCLDISKNEFTRGNFRKGEAFLWKIKAIDSDYDIEAKLREVRAKKSKSKHTESPFKSIEHPNNRDQVVNCDAPKAFNSSVKTNNGTQKDVQRSTQNNVNSNENNFIDNELVLLVKSINENFSKGSLDKAELILNKVEKVYIPADIRAWRHKIQDAKLKIQKENNERRRWNTESLKSEEKKAFDYIEKAKETIFNRDLISTDKYLRDALDLISVPNENLSRNMKNNTEQNDDRNEEQNKDHTEKRKVSNDLEKAMQTEAFKFIKKAEEAFFNCNFYEAEKLLLISERISPDEYVEEMIALIENAKQEDTSKERIANLRKIFLIKQSNTEHDYEYMNLDFAETFKIDNDFDKAQELLKTIENLYIDKKAKEFFRRIQITTENQRHSNYNFGDNDTTINESNKVEAYKCLFKAKEAYREGYFEKAERLLQKSDRMYPTDEAKALFKEISDEYKEEQSYENEDDALECMKLIIPAIRTNNYCEAERLIAEYQPYDDPIVDYALNKITKLCVDKMREVKELTFRSNSNLKMALTALSKGLYEKAKIYFQKMDLQSSDVLKHMFDAIEVMKAAEQNKEEKILSAEAERLLRQAENEISEGNFHNAEIYLNMSNDIKRNTRIDQMLHRLNIVISFRKEDTRQSYWNYFYNPLRGQSEEAERILEKAKINFVKGDFEKVKCNLSHPEVLKCERANRLIHIMGFTRIGNVIYRV